MKTKASEASERADPTTGSPTTIKYDRLWHNTNNTNNHQTSSRSIDYSSTSSPSKSSDEDCKPINCDITETIPMQDESTAIIALNRIQPIISTSSSDSQLQCAFYNKSFEMFDSTDSKKVSHLCASELCSPHQMSRINKHETVSMYLSSDDESCDSEQKCPPYYSCVIERNGKLNLCDSGKLDIEKIQPQNQFCQSHDTSKEAHLSTEEPIHPHQSDQYSISDGSNPFRHNEMAKKNNCEKCGHKLKIQRYFTDSFRWK